MKPIISLALLAALYAGFQAYTVAQTVRLSAPISTTSRSETFGAALDTSLQKVSMAQLLSKPEKYIGTEFQLETKIAKVCQKKGCFFIAQQDEHTMRVSFKDYGFFIPTDSSGKTVLMNGQLIQKQISDAQRDHFRADLQTESPAIESGLVYEIIASSIGIPLV